MIDVLLTEINRYTNNPRKNDKTVPKLMESIKAFGFLQPLVLDTNYTIIVGDTRYLAASKLGLVQVPCIIASHLTEEQVAAYRVADNKIGEMSEWDFAKLDEEFKQWSDLKEEWWDTAVAEMAGKEYTEKPTKLPKNKEKNFPIEDCEYTDEDSPAPAKLKFLILEKRRVPLTDEEYEYLSEEIESYLDRTGSLYGFVSYLKRDI